MAFKRAAKANRRKVIVAEKRRAELFSSSPLARVLRAAQLPVRLCAVTADLFRIGTGVVVLARGAAFERTVGCFLVDTLERGVKDAHVQRGDADFVEYMLATLRAAGGSLRHVEPGYARKLLRDAAAWAHTHGVAPHRDYAMVERLFGDTSADACDATFHFGVVDGPAALPA